MTKLSKKEFGDCIGEPNNYVELKRKVVKTLRKLDSNDFEENRLDTLVAIKHIEENDFGNFISIRFAYWGIILAIAVMVIGDVPIYEYFNMSRSVFGKVSIAALLILLVLTSRTMHYQHDQLEYLNFKLICFDEILGNIKKK